MIENVLRYLRRKKGDGTFEDPIYLGTEPKYVGSIRNANLNNIEEQLLLGVDLEREEVTEDDKTVATTYYRNDENITKCYKSIETTYNIPTESSAFFYEETYYIDRKPNERFDDETLDCDGVNGLIEFIYENEDFVFKYAEGEIGKQYENKLYFDNNLILEKETTRYYKDKKVKLIDKITNHL